MPRLRVSSGSPYEDVIGFSRAVRVGGVIAVGGTAPIGPDGATVGPGDPEAQARRCFEIVRDALEEAGAGLEHVVRLRTFLTDVAHWEAVVRARAPFFRAVRPADTIVQVTRFLDPDWLIEVEADAIVDDPA